MSSYFHKDEPSHKKEHSKIKQIPHFQSASKISQLNFSHNDIRSIPTHITSAFNLQIIDLSHNRIGKIQHVFGLSSLKFVNLSHNLITEVPEDMLQLVELQNLDLGFNKIKILNNIKVLKQLVELRTFKFKGFIQINLEGNDVLKKKGCRDIYHKWMNPSHEDYARMLNKSSYDSMTHRTKKRQAKSVEVLAKSKEQQLLMQTNKTLILSQNNALNKSKDYINSSQNLPDKYRLSPNLSHEINNEQFAGIMPARSQILKSGCNLKDLSAIANDQPDCSCPNEWFTVNLEKLKELNSIFTLIITNQDVKSLQNDIKQKIIEESLYAKQLVNISTEAISQTLENRFSKQQQMKFKEEHTLICQKIKQMHKDILKIFSQKDHLPLKFYKPWVVYFRQLKQLSASIPQKINQHQNKKERFEQIQDLANISPEKEEQHISKSNIQNNQSGSKYRARLDDLLFSKDREDFMLLSDGKRSNSQKKICLKDDGQCENCLMMKWECNKAKDELKQALVSLQKIQAEKAAQSEQIIVLQKIKDKYLGLSAKQELIIDHIEDLEPSTYQNILLEQAKTIQYMLSSEPIANSNKFDRLKNSVTVSTGNQKQLQTRIVSNSNNQDSNRQSNLVSQFVVYTSQDLGSNPARSSSYFKHKNAVTTINRTDENSKTKTNKDSTYKVKKEDPLAHRNQIVVSQFNSEANSLSNSQQKNKQKQYMKKMENRQNSFNKNKRVSLSSNQSRSKNKINHSKDKKYLRQSSQKTQNDVLLLTQQHSGSKRVIQNVTPPAPKEGTRHEEMLKLIDQKLDHNNSKDEHRYRSNGDKFGGIIQLKGRPSFANKRQSKGRMDHQKNKENINPQRLKRAKTNETITQLYQNKYQEHGYNPMKSNQADSYRRYMQYHLRNNIIEILSKKSANSLNQLNNKNNKYAYMTKSQKLINKRPESVLSSKPTERSNYQEVNKTFR